MVRDSGLGHRKGRPTSRCQRAVQGESKPAEASPPCLPIRGDAGIRGSSTISITTCTCRTSPSGMGPRPTYSSYEDLKAGFQDCDLLLIKDQEKTIAGQLIRYESWGPHLWEMGVRDGNREYVAGGAVGSAVFHFSLEYLEGKGHTKVWLGWSRPFLRDGVLQFKRSWSQRIRRQRQPPLLRCGSCPTHPPQGRSSADNPFIFKDRGSFLALCSSMATARRTEEDLQQIDKDYLHDGLSRLLIYDLGGRCGPMFDAAPAELAAHIELRCLGDRP